MSTFDTPGSGLTGYDRRPARVIQQGPRPGLPEPPSPGRAWVQQCMNDKAADLRKKIGSGR